MSAKPRRARSIRSRAAATRSPPRSPTSWRILNSAGKDRAPAARLAVARPDPAASARALHRRVARPAARPVAAHRALRLAAALAVAVAAADLQPALGVHLRRGDGRVAEARAFRDQRRVDHA